MVRGDHEPRDSSPVTVGTAVPVEALRLLIPSILSAVPGGMALASASKTKAASMTTAHEAWRQLATRIPKELHRRLKLHCVTNDISVMDFLVKAIEEKLGRKTGRKKGT